MSTKELVFKLKFVDENGQLVEKTAQSINDINKSIRDLSEEIENTELGSEQWNDLTQELGKAENALEKTNQAINDTKNAQKSLGDQLTSAPGIVGQVSNSVKGLGQTFKALLANPVVAVLAAIVGALTLLFKAFTSTKAGGELLDRVMAGIGATLDVLRDRVLKVGSALIKFFKGDFKGAAQEISGAFKGIGDEISQEFQQAMAIKKELQEITDATRELNKERARQNQEIAKAKLVINDENKSYEERQKALEQVRQAEIALAKQEEILAQRRYEAIKAQNALSDSSQEDLDKEAQAYIQLQQAQQASLQKQKELFDQQKALRDRQRNEEKAAAQQREAELKELRDLEEQLLLEAIEDENERAIQTLLIQERNQIAQIENLKTTEERKQELILKVREETQKKLKLIEDNIIKEAVIGLDEFRKLVIQIEKDSTASMVQLQEQQIQLTEERYDGIIGAVENFNRIYKLKEGERMVTELKMLKEANQQAQQARLDEIGAVERQVEKLKEKQLEYYQTLMFEEKQRYESLVLSGDEIQEERQRQLDDANLLREQGVYDEDQYNKRVTEINEYFNDYNMNLLKTHGANMALLNKEKNDALIASDQIAADKRLEIERDLTEGQMRLIQLREQGFNALVELAGRETALGKALAITQTTISTYQAAQQAYASQLTLLTPDAPLRASLAAGVAIAQGLARVKSILGITFQKPEQAADGMVVGQGSGRSDNVPVMVSNGESIINARSTSMFKPLLSAINQAGGGRRFASGGITGLSTQTSPEVNLLNQISQLQGNTPMKTYVVSSDVSSSQSLDRQIKSRSVL